MDITAPVACTLTDGDYATRLNWITDLTRNGLIGHERRDLSLELRYRRASADRVKQMVRLEEACCAFLSFDVTETPDHLRLTITAPERARDVADLLFAAFTAGVESPRFETAD